MSRLEANKEILKLLKKAVNANPDQRFGQLLRNVGIVKEYRDETGAPLYWLNEFNRESESILDGMLAMEEYSE